MFSLLQIILGIFQNVLLIKAAMFKYYYNEIKNDFIYGPTLNFKSYYLLKNLTSNTEVDCILACENDLRCGFIIMYSEANKLFQCELYTTIPLLSDMVKYNSSKFEVQYFY